MKELHVRLVKDSYGTYVTQFLETPPDDEAPVNIYEFYGYRVGLYAQDNHPENIVESVLRDAVARHLQR